MRKLSATLLMCAVACGGEPFFAATASENAGGSMGHAAGTAPTATAAGGSAAAQDPGAAAGRNSSGSPAGGANPGSGGVATEGGDGFDAAGQPAVGDGGAAPGPQCPSRVDGEWELGFFPELSAKTTQESHPFFQIGNLGAAVATLDRLKIRYYFTRESETPETATCFWVTGDHCSLARMRFDALPQPSATASRYLEVAFPTASKVMVLPGAFEVRVGFKTNSALLIQSNDYSFDGDADAPSATVPFPYKRWPKATLYLDGQLVWGNEPCSGSPQ